MLNSGVKKPCWQWINKFRSFYLFISMSGLVVPFRSARPNIFFETWLAFPKTSPALAIVYILPFLSLLRITLCCNHFKVNNSVAFNIFPVCDQLLFCSWCVARVCIVIGNLWILESDTLELNSWYCHMLDMCPWDF